MAQQEEKRPVDTEEDSGASKPGGQEVRAAIEATQKAIEQSAAEIERSKRLLRETEELADVERATLPPAGRTKGSAS